ncbi:hypothetical protein CAL29_00625 [Bordetella genomosp. 10]|uniref:ABC transporter substrate-binding protein n=2 Tax=Bordetella genomosp. 10 TaxID=1416804 RepID=A0A261SKX5_9BORD|nr:hypothetical protein CAL29_00625 [Bordetella genomosp. 10]
MVANAGKYRHLPARARPVRPYLYPFFMETIMDLASKHPAHGGAAVMGRRRVLAALGGIGLAALTAYSALGAATARAADAAAVANWPEKPVRLIVPYPAGGASDVVARLMAKELNAVWKQPVVVENRAGANGNIGAAITAKAAPDGYTLLLMDVSSLTNSPALYPDLNYSPTKDLAAITIVEYSPHLLVVRKDFPANNLDEMIAYAKAHPGKLNFGETQGSITHLGGIVLAKQAGIDINFIGYKGGAQIATDLVGGQIDMTLNSYLATHALVEGGKVKMLAVASPGKFPPIPDTPVLKDRFPDFVTGSWQGLLTTGGTPPAIVEKIYKDVAAIVAKPDMQAKFAELGAVPVPGTPADFHKFLVEKTDFWTKVIKENHISVN